MLYISRFIEDDHYGVVDTADYHETIISWEDLERDITQFHIPINGVYQTNDGVIDLVVPYQDKKFVTRAQVKARMLLGLDIRLYKDEITGIYIGHSGFEDGRRIRLSDFGRKMSGVADVAWIIHSSGHSVTFVLDDKFEVYGSTLGAMSVHCNWDISDVTDDKFVQRIVTYFRVKSHAYYDIYWPSNIIDKHERWKSLAICE